jgi:hypothetical protein
MRNRGSASTVVGWAKAHVACSLWAVILISGFCSAQTQSAQPDGSLADAARQARTQKAQSGSSEAQQNAQQIADELSEDQNDNGAPGGFKTYNAGDYQLWVPAPYHVDGHDDAGVVLSGPMIGAKHPIVMVGTPIAAHWQNNDDAFADSVSKFSRLYAPTVTCAKTTIVDRPAFQCSLAEGTLLGTHVSGNALFVLGSGNFYPVFCVAPSDSHNRDYLNESHSLAGKERAKQNLSREEDDARTVFGKCDTVFQSFHLRAQATKQDAVPGKASSAAAVVAAKTDMPSSGAVTARPSTQEPQSATPQATTNDPPPASTIPAGFKVHAFNYCKSRTECWNASVLVPADAKLVSSTCKQYAFESKVQETTFLLMAGPAAADCDGNGGADLVRWKQLVDPENKRAPGTYSLISSLNTTLAGKPAVVTTMSFRKGLDSWMGKRGEVESNGVPLVVGCMALRDHFADGDTVCTKLIESLVLP